MTGITRFWKRWNWKLVLVSSVVAPIIFVGDCTFAKVTSNTPNNDSVNPQILGLPWPPMDPPVGPARRDR